MSKTRKIIVSMLVLVSVSACQNVPMWKYSMFDRPAGNYNYPPLYIDGWRDGCESGAQASSNTFYRTQYQFKQNWQLITDTTYRNGWESAYNQCRKFVLQHNMNSEKDKETGTFNSKEEGENLWQWF